MTLLDRLLAAFEQRYDSSPLSVARAPGRVNLIGEHTDYNDGFVLPMAIDRGAWIALRPREDRRVTVTSLDFGATETFDLDGLERGAETWVEYLKGTAWALQEAGYALRGWEGIVSGDVPMGAGLSSSAALELATARAFSAASGFEWEATAIAKIAQRAENEWVGVSCGIMDQLIAARGIEGHALLIDCRSLEADPVPLPQGTAVAILDTATRRGLVTSAYNERRAQCEAAARLFGVKVLRDVTEGQFEARAVELDEITRRRARHVISENSRTLFAAGAMMRGDAALLGRLMNHSHASLRDDFDVSSPALNAIVECARKAPGCYGARMTGAGFAGCAVALVRASNAEAFVSEVTEAFQKETGLTPHIYVCQATNGAEIVCPVTREGQPA